MSERSERTSEHGPTYGGEAALRHLSALSATADVTTGEAL
jgi:hypothetical protein